VLEIGCWANVEKDVCGRKDGGTALIDFYSCCGLGPENVRCGFVGGALLAGAGRPRDKLLAALRNRDADKISEENPPLPIAVVLTDDAKRILMGREGDLLVAVVVDYSKSVG
jgi:hypothetical protein